MDESRAKALTEEPGTEGGDTVRARMQRTLRGLGHLWRSGNLGKYA